MSTNDIVVGTQCTTIMGNGTLLEVRPDGFYVVELDWKLANSTKVTVYTRKEKINFSTPLAVTTQNNDTTKDAAVSPFAILWPAYLCAFVDFLGAGIAIPILPYYVLELGWETSALCPSCPQDPASISANNTAFLCGEVEGCGTSVEVGLSIAFFAFGQVIGNMVMSRLSDKLGRKIIIMISLSASALGYLWCGLAQTLTSLLLARACSGIAGGTLPVVQAMVLDTVGDPRERPKFFGLASACLGLGFMVGPALGAIVNFITGSKRSAFFAPVVVASIALTVAFFQIKETKPGGGVFGPRNSLADKIYDEGKDLFQKDMEKIKRNRSRSGSTDSINSTTSGKNDGFEGKDRRGPTLPTVVFACAACAVLGAFIFTCMTSMTALVWLALFNFGPTELGIFLTGKRHNFEI
jgi:MFS family permease